NRRDRSAEGREPARTAHWGPRLGVVPLIPGAADRVAVAVADRQCLRRRPVLAIRGTGGIRGGGPAVAQIPAVAGRLPVVSGRGALGGGLGRLPGCASPRTNWTPRTRGTRGGGRSAGVRRRRERWRRGDGRCRGAGR